MRFKKNLSTIIVVCFAVIFLFGCSGKWEEYSYEEAGFTAEFPSKPKVKTTKETLSSQVYYLITEYESSRLWGFAGPKYIVTVVEKIDDRGDAMEQDLDRFVGNIRVGLSQDGSNKLFPNMPFDSEYYSGTEFVVVTKNSKNTIRVTINGDLVYGIEVAAPKGKKLSEEIDRFFDSFGFIGESDEEGEYYD